MKKIYTFLLIAIAQFAIAQTIPTSRTTLWKKAGHDGLYPKNVTHLNITNFGGNGNGTTDNSAALTAAITSLGGHAGVIIFPAGDFLFNAAINLSDSIILRGAGASATTFTFNFNNAQSNCININGTTTGNYVSVVSGYTKDSKAIKPTSTAGFAIGDYIEIRELNGAWDTNPATWAQYAVGQILKIDSIKSGKLFFHEKLRIAYDSVLTVQIIKLKLRKSVGIECLKMRRTDAAATGVNYGVSMSKALNCWVKGVEMEKMIGSHVCITTSTHCEITGNYFHEAYAYDGVSTHGYGVLLISHACENKVENNIMRHLRHSAICKEGANGNVIGYNYTLEPTRSEFPSDAGADLLLHGHYAFANLYEGNICQNIQLDQTWGPNGPWNTFFRNRADGYGFIITSGTVPTNDQNIVGNDVTSTAVFKGNYSLTGTNHFEYGNRIKGVVTPAGTTNLTTLSYYLTKAPAWWTSAVAWPCVGEPYSIATETNPARDRYLSGANFTVCSTTVAKLTDDENPLSIEVYPNPSNGIFTLKNASEYNHVVVNVFDVYGKLVADEISSDGVLDLTSQPNGVYLVRINADGNQYTSKIYVLK